MYRERHFVSFKRHSCNIQLISAVFTLETDNPSKTAYPSDYPSI